MMKKNNLKNCAVFLTVLSAIFLVLTNQVYAKAGLGVSDYNVKQDIKINAIQEIIVARIYNVGDTQLEVTVNVINSNENALYVNPQQTKIFLNTEESTQVKVNYQGKQLGSFSGKIEFACNSITTDESQTVPGGSVDWSVKVLEEVVPIVKPNPVVPASPNDIKPNTEPEPSNSEPEPEPEPEQPSNNDDDDTFDITGVGLIGVVASSAVVVVLTMKKRNGKKPERRNPAKTVRPAKTKVVSVKKTQPTESSQELINILTSIEEQEKRKRN